MKILFLSLFRINSFYDTGIYMDLMNEFKRHGHEIYMVCPNERRFHQNTEVIDGENIHLLRVKTLNYQKTAFLEKGLFIFFSTYCFNWALKKFWGKVHFDILIYATPPVSIGGVIKSLKKKNNIPSYLLLKDIDPQGIVDLGVFGQKSLFYKFLRRQEKTLYAVSDYIGCMSPANIDYLLKHNSEIDRDKVEICPNSIKVEGHRFIDDKSKTIVRGKYGIPSDKTIYIYGGNLGIPQGLNFLPYVLECNEKRNDTFFLIVGSGTEYGRIKAWFDEKKPVNAKLLKGLPKQDYDELVASCDVGLLFLDPRFTIPNYPSRLLSYLENKMCIICATDKSTDVGTIAFENSYGLSCLNGDIESFNHCVDELKSEAKRKSMGEKGYQFLQDNYTVEQSYNIIMSHFE